MTLNMTSQFDHDVTVGLNVVLTDQNISNLPGFEPGIS